MQRMDSALEKLVNDGVVSALNHTQFERDADGVRGVNLDEELANTIIYQNAYSASARVITVANQFFDALIEAIRV